MQPNMTDLQKYRMERAREDLEAARLNLENNIFKASINRSYYAIFHAIRAGNAMDSFDARKHSAVIVLTVTFLVYMAMAKAKIEAGQTEHLCKLYA